jgi:hypothetical protein
LRINTPESFGVRFIMNPTRGSAASVIDRTLVGYSFGTVQTGADERLGDAPPGLI